jgi:hypothetical protein
MRHTPEFIRGECARMTTAPEVSLRAQAQLLFTPANQQAQPSTQDMPETSLDSIYQSLMHERDQIRETMGNPPKAEQHVSIAIFEAWADGKIAEPQVKEHIRKVHQRIDTCDVCLENLEYYRARRADIFSSII